MPSQNNLVSPGSVAPLTRPPSPAYRRMCVEVREQQMRRERVRVGKQQMQIGACAVELVAHESQPVPCGGTPCGTSPPAVATPPATRPPPAPFTPPAGPRPRPGPRNRPAPLGCGNSRTTSSTPPASGGFRDLAGCGVLRLSPRRHDSDLADAQWRLIELLLPPPATAGRPEKHPRHEIVHAIPAVARTGLADRQPLDPRVASDRREIRR
jgi:hypothetical protein